MAELYTPPEISQFLVTEKLAFHGISPDVYAQNQELVRQLGAVTRDVGQNLLGLQIIGSRANGTSGLESDLDLAVLQYRKPGVRTALESQLAAIDHQPIELDLEAAALASCIDDEVPANASEFIEWITESDVANVAGLFEDGIYVSPNLQLGRLAALHVIQAQGSAYARRQWQDIRRAHAETYAGQKDSMRTNLVARLGVEQQGEIMRAVSHNVMTIRRELVALPQLTTYSQDLEAWHAAQLPTVQQLEGYELYQAVRQELAT